MPAKKLRTIRKTNRAKGAKETGAGAAGRIQLAKALAATSGFVTNHDFPVETLAGIVRSEFPGIDEDKIADLYNETHAATTQLNWDSGQPDKQVVADKFLAVEDSAFRLLESLSAVLGGSSEGPFFNLLAPAPSSPEQMEMVHRIRHYMIGDLLLLRSRIRPGVQMILDTKLTRKDFEYRCAFRIAAAWLTATGKKPSLTRNTDAVSGPQATAFQRYMAEAVKPKIGDFIMREAIAAVGALTGT